MASDSVLCATCGITLRPFMRVCPRCGARREGARPMHEPPQESTPARVAPEPDRGDNRISLSYSPNRVPGTEVAPFEIVRRPRASGEASGATGHLTPARNQVLLAPGEERRRFPLFTTAQWTLIALGVALLLMMIVIAYLLWRQQQRDTAPGVNPSVVAAQPSPNATPTPETSPTPTPSDDQAVYESVRTQLMAYNPSGFSRYRFEVKDGVVTVNGEAAHQPEKDGVESVLKLITGVKSVVNNLKVKPDEALAPVKLNLAEAKILDDALRREVESREQATNLAPPNPPQQPKQTQPSDAQREAREKAAAKFREEDMATRRAAEEKLRREAEEYERKQEELRRAEAERRSRAEQSRVEVVSLRSGTVAWSGTVDGVDEVVISGSSASVRHVSGASPREVKASFSAPVPRSPVSVALISANGRGAISVVQQPSAANGYTTIVRVDDSSKGGDKRYEFTLRWTAQ
jgi:BON domain